MSYQFDVAGVARIEAHFAQIGGCLRDKRKRESFAMYAFRHPRPGGAQERRADRRARVQRRGGSAAHARQSPPPPGAGELGSNHAMRRVAARYALAALSTRREEVTTWVIDGTGFLKQGKCSVGAQRQYTDSEGKIANCQVGVGLSVATRTEHLPIDFALYWPTSWTEDPAPRAAARNCRAAAM
jgi:hypothetical protein